MIVIVYIISKYDKNDSDRIICYKVYLSINYIELTERINVVHCRSNRVLK